MSETSPTPEPDRPADPHGAAPDPDAGFGLVEPEGVNAGSGRAAAQSPHPTRDATGPAVPDAAADEASAARARARTSDGDAELVGAPGSGPEAPGQYAAETGQDDASME